MISYTFVGNPVRQPNVTVDFARESLRFEIQGYIWVRALLALAKTVLLVEDESSVRSVVAEYLREIGWAVIEVPSAFEAMSVLNSDSPVDIAFVDFKLPGGPTGSMLAQWIESRTPNFPVLLTSGLTETHSGFGRGKLRRFIPKPYELSDIGRLLTEMVEP